VDAFKLTSNMKSLWSCNFFLSVFVLLDWLYFLIYIYPVGASTSCLLKNLCEELVQNHVIWNTNVEGKCYLRLPYTEGVKNQ